MKVQTILALLALILCRSAFGFTTVTYQTSSEGSVEVQVLHPGTPGETWRINVHAIEGDSYSVVYSTSTGSMHLDSQEFGAVAHHQGDWVMTSYEPEFFGTTVHSTGAVVYPPGVNPPDRPPYYPQGFPPVAFNARIGDGELQFFGCGGAALAAVGAYILNGRAASAFVRGAVRGSLGGPGAGMGAGALATVLGATGVVIDACMMQ